METECSKGWHGSCHKSAVRRAAVGLIGRADKKDGRRSKKILVDLTIALGNRYHLQSVLSILEPLHVNAGAGFVLKHSVDPRTNSHRLIILHELGRKYSHLMFGFLKATFDTFGMRIVDSIATEKSGVMRISENRNYR